MNTPSQASPYSPTVLYRISGPDAEDLLNRLSTVPLLSSTPSETDASLGHLGFFLEPTGKILSGFGITRESHPRLTDASLTGGSRSPTSEECDDSFLVEIQENAGFSLLNHLDFYTFGEKLQTRRIFENWHHQLFLIKSKNHLSSLVRSDFDFLSSALKSEKESNNPMAEIYFIYPSYLDNSFLLSVWSAQQWNTLHSPIQGKDFEVLPFSEADRIRLQIPFWHEYRPSRPAFNAPVSPTEPPSEVKFNPIDIGLSKWVSTPKGCFPGQEVIEKLLTGGKTQFGPKTVVIELKNAEAKNAIISEHPLPVTIFQRSEEGQNPPVGTLTSWAENPARAKNKANPEAAKNSLIGFAIVRKSAHSLCIKTNKGEILPIQLNSPTMESN